MVARHGAQVGLSSDAEERIRRARELIAKWVHENKVIYGITTGFGAICNVTISEDDTRRLQENILRIVTGITSPKVSEDFCRSSRREEGA
ncbi:MAG: aromatic amino acid lyase [bacterium]|nr:aromatic amino acid lyase [bacterium]